ncbi:MAG: hypothetical protein GY952_02960 [Rhodobacteraceae bacterium]|nr:hypothetical protein [Paracoccaceae bacterium]
MPSSIFLKKLGEYKEFIAIVSAALGGFIWFESLVAKQKDLVQIKDSLSDLATVSAIVELDCQLDLYMTLTQVQMQVLANSKRLAETKAEAEIVNAALESAENQFTIQTLKNRQRQIKETLDSHSTKQKRLNDQTDETALKISTNSCG